MSDSIRTRGKLLFLVTEDWYFCSHRLQLARAARESGFEVVVATRVHRDAERIRDAGLRVIPIGMRPRGNNPFKELAALTELIRIYRTEKPTVSHQVALKPVIYGWIAAHLARVPVVVNALAGLGFVYSSANYLARFLRPFVTTVLGVLLRRRRTQTVVQNPDDAAVLEQIRVPSQRITIIKGSGVDVSLYRPQPEPESDVVITMVSRMLWDKGVAELIESARTLKKWKVRAQLWLVGSPDSENPASISEPQLRDWEKEGLVHWLGHQPDIPEIWARSHVAVLPSYREGLPKALLEAAACARPIVATDVPGCREIVREGENGLLVPVKDSNALALAITKLVNDSSLRTRMGARGREMVLQEFSEQTVIDQTLALYSRALAEV